MTIVFPASRNDAGGVFKHFGIPIFAHSAEDAVEVVTVEVPDSVGLAFSFLGDYRDDLIDLEFLTTTGKLGPESLC